MVSKESSHPQLRLEGRTIVVGLKLAEIHPICRSNLGIHQLRNKFDKVQGTNINSIIRSSCNITIPGHYIIIIIIMFIFPCFIFITSISFVMFVIVSIFWSYLLLQLYHHVLHCHQYHHVHILLLHLYH